AQIQKTVQSIPGAADVSREHLLGLPQLNIKLKRQAIARYGLNVKEVQGLIQTALAGSVVTEVVEGSKRFGVLVRFPLERRDTEEDIRNMLISTPDGVRIPLKQLADIQRTNGVVMVNREDGQRRGAVLVNIRGRDLGGWVAEAQKAVSEKVEVPRGYWLVWGGQFENQQRAMTRLCIVVPVVLFLIFILLYFTFQSLKNAALVMLNVPFATIGGIIALFISHQPLSVPAIIGFIALFGVAVQNAVILISYIMQLEQRGLSTEESIIEGSLVRLRPVLMTALVAMMGLLPKLFSDGTGAEIQRPLATVVFGGLLSATALTLLVLPAIYKLLHKASKAPSAESIPSQTNPS
ncbi:MAG: efflux RND transporter permease subunit, partial [Candidatus Obscuribacterales bacterium]|nr:efflux RND transporter permease subunit [Candidatus Obscuribacterales bacterium]